MAINDISLGDFSAENDRNLSKYFLDDTPEYSAAKNINDHRYILLGRTGSGKSAILSHIYEKHKEDNRFLCVFIRPGKSYLDAVVQTQEFHDLKESEGLQNILYKLIWNYVIMVSVLKQVYGHRGPMKRHKFLSGEKLRAYRFLQRVEQLAQEDQTLFDVFIGLIKEINFSIKGIDISCGTKENSSYKIMRDLIKETEDFHEKGFWDVVSGKKLYLLFDDLDLGWDPGNQDQQLLLRGLFEIMKSYAYRERVKPLIALRTNILDRLNIPQREKYENNVLPLRWTKPNLKKMLLLRLIEYGKLDAAQGFESFFYSDSNPDFLVDYMITRTLYRPRDLLAFCKYAISDASRAGVDKITLDQVSQAESTYSINRLQALEDEWRYSYPSLKSFVTLMIKITTRDYNVNLLKPKELRNILVEMKERIVTAAPEEENQYAQLIWMTSYFVNNDDPVEIVKVLYRLGILGIRSEHQEFMFVFESQEMPTIVQESEFTFHPMLHRIPTGGFQFKEDNPWI
ncbi:MAG: P-loop ATPase, Sll1717 family [Leptolyngbyaceae cyanobacterium]